MTEAHPAATEGMVEYTKGYRDALSTVQNIIKQGGDLSAYVDFALSSTEPEEGTSPSDPVEPPEDEPLGVEMLTIFRRALGEYHDRWHRFGDPRRPHPTDGTDMLVWVPPEPDAPEPRDAGYWIGVQCSNGIWDYSYASCGDPGNVPEWTTHFMVPSAPKP